MVRTGMEESLAMVYGQLLQLEGLVETMLGRSIDALKDRNAALSEEIIRSDDEVDELAQTIEEKAVETIALQQPVGSDLRRMIGAIRNVINLERIADLAVNIAELVPDLARQPLLKPLIDIPRMAQIAREMLHDGLDALRDDDVEKARQVCLRDEEIDGLFMQVFRELVLFMTEDPRTINRAVPLLFVARYLERVGDHATNIAEVVYYQKTGKRTTVRDIMAEEERRRGDSRHAANANRTGSG
jgi:phosphate transport system protein